MLVVGAPNSSNSVRLVEVARAAGCPRAVLMQTAASHRLGLLDGVATVAISAGASAPELLVEEVIAACRERFAVDGRGGRGRRGERVLQSAADPAAARVVSGAGAAAGAAGSATRRLSRWRSTPRRRRRAGAFLADYDLGQPVAWRASPRGWRTPTSACVTERGRYILTIYEKRVDPADLPFFLGLMEHLAARGCPARCRSTAATAQALRSLCGKPAAIVSFLEGRWPRRVAAGHCAALGEALARAASGRRRFRHARPNALSVAGWRPLFEACRGQADACWPGLEAEIGGELDALERHWPDDLPRGVIHADLFPDNVFFAGRPGDRHHRLLLRLQRPPGLRPRDLPERLVLRARRRLQHHQGAPAARGLSRRAAAHADASSRPCRCSRAARRCASC